MSDSGKAVFLSYASQDSEAAKRICDTLRAAGVEVWFDAEGGLEHGDEWDAKIRRQIKECVLFLPIISANTEAREEGYFRIEWELAAQRSLGIASGVAFILPVVVDDTKEQEALVPDRFRTVQWTKARGGELTPEQRTKFVKLWSHRAGVLKHEAVTKGPKTSDQGPGTRDPGLKTLAKPGWKAYAGIAAGIVVLMAAVGWWALRPSPAAPTSSPAPQAPSLPPAPAAASDARQLVAKARALFINGLDTTRDDCALAEDLLKQAQAKDQGDAEVWAALAHLHGYYLLRGWDVSEARREANRQAVQRAVRLDPSSFEARLAQAFLLADQPSDAPEKERRLRELRAERPAEKRVLRALASLFARLPGRLEEANALNDESAALPGGDPLALYNKSLNNWFAGRTVEAEAAIKEALAQQPFTGARIFSAWYRTILHGDLDGARAAFAPISAQEMQEDRPAYFAYYVELLARDPAAAMARLQAVPRGWFEDSWYRGPKSLLMGDVLAAAGRDAAAATEWRAALQIVQERLKSNPNQQVWLALQIELLAKLDQREAAAEQFAAITQRFSVNPDGSKAVPRWVTELSILLGRKAEAIRQIRLALKRERRAVDFTAVTLRLDPEFDPLRSEPEFTQVIAEAERIEQEAAATAAAKPITAQADTPALDPKVAEARALVAKATPLHTDLDDGTRADFELAEQMFKRALELAPLDAEVWANYSWFCNNYLGSGLDRTPEREAETKRSADRAIKLDPTSEMARFSWANYYRRPAETADEAIRILRELTARHPDQGVYWRVLALACGRQEKLDEALAAVDQAVALPGGDARAWVQRGDILYAQGRMAEAEAAYDRSLAVKLTGRGLVLKAAIRLFDHGDLAGAEELMARVPGAFRQEDRATALAAILALWKKDTTRCLQVLQAYPRDYFDEGGRLSPLRGPKAGLAGWARWLEGKPELARLEWAEAVRVIDARLANRRTDQLLLSHRARLLAVLGRQAEAEEAGKIVAQLDPQTAGWWQAFLDTWTGQLDRAFAFLEGKPLTPSLRYDPGWEPVRRDPRWATFVAKAEAAAVTRDPKSQTPDASNPPSADSKSIAVLAFANLSDDKANEYFSDGISEELLNVLAKVPGLKVSARTSAFHFKGKDTAIREIARQLGVAYVVEGSVRKQGDKVRITAQLIKAADGFHVWSDSFTRDLKDIFAVQDEIAGLIAQSLQLKLGESTRAKKVVNPEAHQLVLKGRHYWALRGEANLAIAEDAYQRALQLDPVFAEAHAGMADVWTIRAWYRTMAGGGPTVAEDLRRAEVAIQRATTLDPSLAEPQATLGTVRFIEGKFGEVEAPFQRAFALNPNYAVGRHWHGTHLMSIGRFDTSLAELREATRLDPLAPMPLWTLAAEFNIINLPVEAFATADRALRLRPGFLPLLSEKALAAWSLGRRDEALACAREIAGNPAAEARWWADVDALYVLREAGQAEEAQRLADRVIATVAADDYRRPFVLATLGRMDEALAVRSVVPTTALIRLMSSPIWDPVRDDPRFHAMVERLGYTAEFRSGRSTLERMRREQEGRK